ncbi:S41 family peptidase [Facklamia miroungae]|uniref:Carboxyl-terminal processing protease n=1 Tax=Facklamia miroungae TaxID=120956 RepID=A0A1G7P914_9LACT|nr:S41 family peptidase [Facklamia miroungae]NKZ28605.1 S41 family peptidase [Facklamia miroungae]SDF82089.1 carboxyl-terminal processing protease [Facklamia miroungae]
MISNHKFIKRKNKKQNQWYKDTWFRLFLILSVLGIVVYFKTLPISARGGLFETPTIEKEDQLTKEDLAVIQEVYNSLQINYIEELDKNKLIEGALKGMVEAVDDPYSEFLNPSEMTPFDDSLEGSFTGIGVQFMLKEGLPTVIAPVDGTPAAKAGIKANDIFLTANGVELQGLDTSEIVQHIRGPLGSEITLTVKRGDSTFDVTMTREEIPLTTVTAEQDADHKQIGVVKVSQFASSTYDEMVAAVKELRSKGADRFIFDFRYNPGGMLETALQVSNMFLEDDQVIMQTDDRLSEPIEYLASDERYGSFQITEPYVLLIDEGSASASEILAAAIKENTDAPVIGVTSFGKGTVQRMISESDYGELKLTVAKWLTPSGGWIHEKGIEPDEKVETPEVANAIMLNQEEDLKMGDASEYVHSASLMLQALGYQEEVSAYFSPEMEEAIKKFQKDQQIEETGIIDSTTSDKLVDEIRTFLEKEDPQYQAAVKVLLGD